jgi:hypothetical protein
LIETNFFLLDVQVGFVIDERLRQKKNKHKVCDIISLWNIYIYFTLTNSQ